jgi:hypothetical protein
MKILLFNILLITNCFYSFCEVIDSDYYTILSDVKVDTIKPGKCIVKGRAVNPYSEEGIANGMIANFNKTIFAITDVNGYYQLELGTNDTALFFYHKKYKEIIIWNYDFKSQHLVTINFVSSEKLEDGIIYEVEKPVIYLYPEVRTNIRVALDKNVQLTYTYPLYNDGWVFEAYPNGELKMDGKSFPYLFWEGEKKYLNFKIVNNCLAGFFIKTDTVVSFLEDNLTTLGLNFKERTDFITYWAPRLQNEDTYATIQFFVDQQYNEEIGNISIEPKPNSMRRIFMIYAISKNGQPSTTIVQPTLETFNREGFVVMEWGGSNITRQLAP